MVFIPLIIACISLAYATYLHIYYQKRGVRTLREVEERKFRENMYKLGYDDGYINIEMKIRTKTLADLCDANKVMKKALKRYKL